MLTLSFNPGGLYGGSGSQYVMGDFDKGLFVISGKPADGVSMEDAEKGIQVEIDKMRSTLIDEKELTKCKNKVESSLLFSETDVLTKATNLAVAELMGDADLVNREGEKYQAVTAEDVKKCAIQILDEKNCSTLYYLKKN